MTPHYLSHCKRKVNKMYGSKKTARECCIGKSKRGAIKPVRPKGEKSIRGMEFEGMSIDMLLCFMYLKGIV